MNSMVPLELGQFFYKLEEISFVRIALILVTAFALITVVKRVLPWVARQMPGRLRLYILPLVPVLRVVIIFVSVLSVIPLVIKPTAQNLVALFGALGLALGFAFKDYASGLIAGIVLKENQPAGYETASAPSTAPGVAPSSG